MKLPLNKRGDTFISRVIEMIDIVTAANGREPGIKTDSEDYFALSEILEVRKAEKK